MDTSMLVRAVAGALALVVLAVIVYRRKQKA
jgi:LPXTG-motif cell wall-anchored protein